MNHVYAARRSFSLIAIFLLISTVTFSNTYTVTNTNPSGPGSLDQAIIDANANPGPDSIVFNITGTGPFVIAPGFPGLTAITEDLTIDGYSQPGSTIGPIATRVIQIVINGAGAGFSNGVTINSDNVTIDGLDIISFGANGISVPNGNSNIFIWGNFIGVDPTGFAKFGNTFDGISLGDGGPGGANGVTIGTNSDGTNDDSEGNLVSGNGQHGITGWALTNSVISGNFVGSDRTGQGTTLGNTVNGILLTVGASSNRIGSNGDGVNDVQELNGVIKNGGAGIVIAAGSAGNMVAGNIVGLNTAGVAAGNNGNGIAVINSVNNRIGLNSSDPDFDAERNVVSSNLGDGISIIAQNFFGNTDPSAGNVVQGNYVGTTPANDSRGNGGNGVSITAPSAGFTNIANLIGSNNDGIGDDVEGNIIAYNSVIGIAMPNFVDINNNTISRNSTYSNSALGIDLGGDGVTANDNGDGDVGVNDLYNFPVITHSNSDGVNMTIAGLSRPGSIIEVFADDGSGEGKIYLFTAQQGTTYNGITDVSTGTGSYSDPTYGTFTDDSFRFVIPRGSVPFFPPGSNLVATGTDPVNGTTSEFGPSILLTPLTLTSFQGQLVDGLVKLSWTSTREINFSHFVIEKSLDGTSYNAIGQVNSGGTNGKYAFTDATPLGKANYYRLKMVDQDGKFTYSKALLIRNDIEGLVVKISPNPISTYLNVSFKLEKPEVVKLNIYDQMGRVTKRYTLQGSRGINVFNISDLNNLPAGNYVIELKGETVVAKEKLVKN